MLGQSKSRPFLTTQTFPVKFRQTGLIAAISSGEFAECDGVAVGGFGVRVGGRSFCIPRLVKLFGRGMVIQGVQ